jgi:dTDP-glucose 4,6-dehydratase
LRLLITGGCGFIGSNFIRYLFSSYKDIKVTNVDKLTYCGNQNNLSDISANPAYEFIKGDICDAALADDLVKGVDYVVNFAAETHVDRSIKYPDDFIRTNVYGVKTMLEAARKTALKRFIQISTDEVYGDVLEGFSSENDKLDPKSPYAATKASGDLLALSYHKTYGLPVIVVRSSNNFGPFQYPEKMIPLFITNLLQGKKVPVYGKGDNIRDWLFVGDNCKGIDIVRANGTPGEIYNIGGGNLLSNMELTKMILPFMNKTEDFIEYVKDRPGHDKRYALDSNKAKALGWAPGDGFPENILNTIKWYKNNETWWKPLRDKAEIIQW